MWSIVSCSTLAFLALASGHVYNNGDCPRVELQRDFDLQKFVGEWHVLQRFQTSSSCIKEKVTFNGRDYLMYESMKPFGINVFTEQMGKIIQTNGTASAALQVDYPLSPLGPNNYWIMSTDYQTYALVWSCQRLFWGHRQSGQILSRSPLLRPEIVQKLRRKLSSYGINEHELSIVDQTHCDPEAPTKVEVEVRGQTIQKRVGSFETRETKNQGPLLLRLGPLELYTSPEA